MQNSRRNACNTRQKFKPQHNETILSVQYFKLKRKSEESAWEWMGRLQIKANKYQIYDRRPKEQFINGLNDETTAEIIKELTAQKDTSEVSSNHVLIGPRGKKVQKEY